MGIFFSSDKNILTLEEKIIEKISLFETNNDFREVMNEYKENEDAFLYLDPPYMDSYDAGYSSHQNKNYNSDLSVKDNTEMYIFLLEFLKHHN